MSARDARRTTGHRCRVSLEEICLSGGWPIDALHILRQEGVLRARWIRKAWRVPVTIALKCGWNPPDNFPKELLPMKPRRKEIKAAKKPEARRPVVSGLLEQSAYNLQFEEES